MHADKHRLTSDKNICVHLCLSVVKDKGTTDERG